MPTLPINWINALRRGGGSPIQLKVDYTNTQFVFKFKLPSDKFINIYDGDGTATTITGQDDTLITHTTSYSTAGTYYFYVEGDYVDITGINIQNQAIASGSISRWSELVNLTLLVNLDSGTSGSISNWGRLLNMEQLTLNDGMLGDISVLSTMLSLNTFSIRTVTTLYGDLSTLYQSPFVSLFGYSSEGITFDNIQNFIVTNRFWVYDAGWDSNSVDNALISLANGGTTGRSIKIAGNNAARTSASDAAKLTLLDAGNTVEVNEYDKIIELDVAYNGTDQFDFTFILPSGKSIILYWGDGTQEEVDGIDDTLITKTSSYSPVGSYTFYVEGDIYDLIHIAAVHQDYVTGDITDCDQLPNLKSVGWGSSGVTGSVNGLAVIETFESMQASYANLTCNLELFTSRNMTTLTVTGLLVTGDMSYLNTSNAPSVAALESNATFDRVVSYTAGNLFYAYDNNWTSAMVDNCLISLYNGGTTGRKIKIAGNNAARTSASDVAAAWLLANNTAFEVNE